MLAVVLFPSLGRCEETLAEVLERLDGRAAELRTELAQGRQEPVRVAALVARGYASEMDNERAYVVATFSFEHATRDDEQNVVRNDWDLLFGNGQGNQLTVRMVTDDASRMWNLGEVDFDTFKPGDAGQNAGTGGENAVAREKHLYVIHTLDSETNLWAKFQVLELEEDKSVIFRWELIEDPALWQVLERPAGSELESGLVHIQLQAGGVGGNPCRAFMNRKVDACVDSVSPDPLDLEDGLAPEGNATAYISGGFIPEGKVWILRSVEYAGFNRGDKNGDGQFVVGVCGKQLAVRKPRSGEFKDVWKGRMVVRPGQEDTVFAEISNSSTCDVKFRGILCAEKWADTLTFPELGPVEKARVETLLSNLDAEDPKARDLATEGLIELGPPILDYLRKLSREKRFPEFLGRLDDVISKLGGE